MTTINLSINTKQAEALSIFFSKLNYDQIDDVINGNKQGTDDTAQLSYEIWDTIDDFYRYLLDLGFSEELSYDHEEDA